MCQLDSRAIAISTEQSVNAQVSVLCHELAHALVVESSTSTLTGSMSGLARCRPVGAVLSQSIP
jgi:hypothetical protein